MSIKTNLFKMKSEVVDSNVNYSITYNDSSIIINDLLGKKITLEHTGVINCIKCGAVTNKSYAQGFCYSCMINAPETEECVLKPELCKAHLGIARDIEYAKEHCLKPHFVYLSNTGVVKVGVTRQSQIPIRWVDQGATAAIKLCKTPNRHIAGLIEVHLSQFFTDKTLWRKMVSDNVDEEDMIAHKEKAISHLLPTMLPFVIEENKVYNFIYPATQYPAKPKTATFDKQPKVEGILTGIKGQYLIIDGEHVFNVRRHNGYEAIISWE